MPNPPQSQTQHQSYNAANQVAGWQYDAAGNLLNDTYSQYQYDTLGRVTHITNGGVTRNNTYNGDGVLVQQDTTRYVQDLAAPLSQILSDGSAVYVYGKPAERLYGVAGSTRTWYRGDAHQGSWAWGFGFGFIAMGAESQRSPNPNPQTRYL